MQLLRLHDAMSRTGLSRSAVYAAIADGTFPKPVRIGRRSVAWPAEDIDAWITARIRLADRTRYLGMRRGVAVLRENNRT